MRRLRDLLSGAVPPDIYRFHSRVAAASIQRVVAEHDAACFVIDGRAAIDKPSFLAASARAFHVPSYFGHNWDALEECVRDLSWARADRYIVLYDAVAVTATHDPASLEVALDILETAVEHWRATATPMYVLLRGTRGTQPDRPLLA